METLVFQCARRASLDDVDYTLHIIGHDADDHRFTHDRQRALVLSAPREATFGVIDRLSLIRFFAVLRFLLIGDIQEYLLGLRRVQQLEGDDEAALIRRKRFDVGD